MASLRVLMVNYEFPPLGGGTGIACSQLLEELGGRRDIEVELVTSDTGSAVERTRFAKGVTVHRLPTPKRDMQYWRASELLGWTRRALVHADALSRDRRFDLCHCWAGWPSGIVGYWLRRRQPYVVSLRGSDVPGYNKRLRVLDPLVMRHLCRQVWGRSARVVAVSRSLRALAHETQPDARIDVIPNGVDVRRFTPGDEDGRGLLFVGRLIERKGADVLVEAFGLLAAAHPDLTLTIVGDGPERPRLEEIARGHGLGGRVSFRGHLEREALAQAYRDAAVFVLPAASDAMPNVVLEAMAAGLAIVTTRTGAAELLRGNGQMVERADPEDLRAALERYLEDPGLLAQHRHASRRLAEQMSWSSVADFFLAVYAEVITAPEHVVSAPGREFRMPAT
jgi:L-malate glycosyltransferase